MTIPTEIAATVSLPVVALVTALTITPADITAMFVALTALVTALGVAVINIMAARTAAKKLDAVVAAQAENDKVAWANIDEVGRKAEAIKTSVDGAAHASVAKIDAMENELRLLRVVMAEKKETAALLAQAAATTGTAPAPARAHTGRAEDATASPEAKVDAPKDEP